MLSWEEARKLAGYNWRFKLVGNPHYVEGHKGKRDAPLYYERMRYDSLGRPRRLPKSVERWADKLAKSNLPHRFSAKLQPGATKAAVEMQLLGVAGADIEQEAA